MLLKIFLLPRLVSKSIQEEIDIPPGADLRWLLAFIRANHSLELVRNEDCIIILDGEAIETEKQLDRDISACGEMWILPLISGG
jgi:hypothetical protein